ALWRPRPPRARVPAAERAAALLQHRRRALLQPPALAPSTAVPAHPPLASSLCRPHRVHHDGGASRGVPHLSDVLDPARVRHPRARRRVPGGGRLYVSHRHDRSRGRARALAAAAPREQSVPRRPPRLFPLHLWSSHDDLRSTAPHRAAHRAPLRRDHVQRRRGGAGGGATMITRPQFADPTSVAFHSPFAHPLHLLVLELVVLAGFVLTLRHALGAYRR